ncbi:hypothetical protein SAMN05421877_1096 [Sphingobacterium lactis]|uniref:Uncharacterized protein n=1 Tax=Sphingobacterium lactis TaxID=797291 RepID=A0A1H6AVL5_9SPHI|nr:hypothetical protein SAMN05421877_1096 [Sphingobacterium lactis]
MKIYFIKSGQDFDSKVTDEKKEEVKGIFAKFKTILKLVMLNSMIF